MQKVCHMTSAHLPLDDFLSRVILLFSACCDVCLDTVWETGGNC